MVHRGRWTMVGVFLLKRLKKISQNGSLVWKMTTAGNKLPLNKKDVTYRGGYFV